MYKTIGEYLEVAGILAVGFGIVLAFHQLRILIPTLFGLAAIYYGQHLQR